MANFITGLRILGGVLLLFCRPLSVLFYTIYLLAGITDIIDGAVARKFKSTRFGAKFDTVADFVLMVACLIKLLPQFDLERWIYFWILAIALLKGINALLGVVYHHSVLSVHTVLNKIAGAVLFALPFTLLVIPLKYSAIFACSVTTVAAIYEQYYMIIKRKYT